MSIDSIDDVSTGKTFRFSNTRALFTYKTHLPKVDFANYLRDKCHCDIVICAHENGDKNHEYQHTHVFVKWPKVFQTRNARFFDYNGIHPNIKAITTREHEINVYTYLKKEDPENADLMPPDDMKRPFDRICATKTPQEALRLAGKFTEAQGIVTMYKYKPQIQLEVDRPNMMWHKAVFALIAMTPQPDDRLVHWYYDPIGGTGKSWLALYLFACKNYVCFKAFGGIRDMSTIIKSQLDAGRDPSVVVCDLPRACETKAIYEPLESIKDKIITTQKYEGTSFHIPPCHLLVMANFLPQLDAMSLDRWRIYHVSVNTIEDLTLDQVRQIKADAVEGEAP